MKVLPWRLGLPLLLGVVLGVWSGCQSTPTRHDVDVAWVTAPDSALEDAWISATVQADLVSRLAMLPEARVLAQGADDHRPSDSDSAGDAVVTATVERLELGDYVLSLAIKDAHTGELLWRETVRRKRLGTAVVEARRQLALALSKTLGLALPKRVVPALSEGGTDSAAAYESYGIARAQLLKDDVLTVDEAIAHLNSAVQTDPGFGDAWVLLGHAQEMAGDRDAAIEAQTEALRLVPLSVAAQLTQVRLTQRTEPEVAAHHAAIALQISPRDPAVRRAHARALFGSLEALLRAPDFAAVTARRSERLRVLEAQVDADPLLADYRPKLAWYRHRVARLAEDWWVALREAEAAWMAYDVAGEGVPHDVPEGMANALQRLRLAPSDSEPSALLEGRDYPDTPTELNTALVAAPGLLAAVDCTGARLLHLAADRGDSVLVSSLLAAGATPHARTRQLETALHRAAWRGHADIAAALLKAGASRQARDRWGRTPLHRAVWAGHRGVMALLLEAGASVQTRTLSGWTALHEAARFDQVAAASALIDAGAATDSASTQGDTPLLIAVRHGHVAVARRLLDQGAISARPDAVGRTPLHVAAGRGDLAMARLLLDHRASTSLVDGRGRTPLHHATLAGRPAMVDLLVTRGADVNQPDEAGLTSLHLAVGDPNVDTATVEALITAGADVEAADRQGDRPLSVAAHVGAADKISSLLAAGATVDAGRSPDAWPIVAAARAGHPKAVEVLFEAIGERGGADRNIALGKAMEWAADGGHIPVIDLLVAGRVPLNQASGESAALLAAARRGRAKTVRRVINLGGRVSGARQLDGATALHVAAAQNQVETIHALVDAGADVDQRDHNGRPPLAWSIVNHADAATAALLAREARADLKVGDLHLIDIASIHDARDAAVQLLSHGANETLFIAAWLGRDAQALRLLRRDRRALKRLGPDGLGVLHQAARGGSATLVRRLLAAGAPLEQWSEPRGDGGLKLPALTPLHFALLGARIDVAEVLIKANANPFVTKDGGPAPVALAARLEMEESARLNSVIGDWIDADDKRARRYSKNTIGGWGPNPPAPLGMVVPGVGKHRGAMQLRERILSVDNLIRRDVDGDSDVGGPAEGYEPEVRRCVRGNGYREALRHSEDLRALRHKWGDPDGLLTALIDHNVGRLSHFLARYGDAKRLLTQALATFNAIASDDEGGGPITLLQAAARENLANVAAVRGDYVHAEAGYREVLAILADSAVAAPGRIALTWSNLGNLLTERGRYADAEQALREALALRSGVLEPTPTEVAASQHNLAALLSLLGEHDAAEALFKASLLTLEDADLVPADQLALAKHNVATTMLRRGAWADAEALEREALEVITHAYPDGHYAVGRMRLALAHALVGLGRDADAATEVDLALNALRSSHGELHGFIARTLLLRSELAARHGDSTLARSALREALAIAYTADAPEERWPIEYAFGRRLIASGNPRRGVVFLKQAVNTLQRLRSGLGRSSTAAYLADRTAPYRTLADQLIADGRLPEATQVLAMLKEEELAQFATRSMASIKSVRGAADFVPSEAEWMGRFRAIRDDLTGLGTEFRDLLDRRRLGELTEAGKARLAAIRKDLAIGRRAFDAFLEVLRDDAGKSGLSRTEDLAQRNLDSLRAMQGVLRTLGHGAVLVHYLVTDDGLRILLTTADVQIARQSRIPRARLNRLIADFRHVLEDPTQDPLPLAGELYDIVVAPIADDLAAAAATTLMLSLDGALRYVPYDALHDGEYFMLERYRIAHFSDASKPHLLAKRPADWRIAALGLSKQHPGFDALPAVPAELSGIVATKRRRGNASAGSAPGIIRLDEAFTSSAFQSALEDGFPVIHIASHFVFKPGTERDSFLLMGDGQQLTLDAIRYEGFAFDDVALLTLSACNTAVGITDPSAGSEVEGFAAMTQKLGVKGVVATLWPVADGSTGHFMRQMYLRYAAADSAITKADAVRQAKLSLLRGTDDLEPVDLEPHGHMAQDDAALEAAVSEGDYAHPYYWAPFVLMGNWL